MARFKYIIDSTYDGDVYILDTQEGMYVRRGDSDTLRLMYNELLDAFLQGNYDYHKMVKLANVIAELTT